MKGILLAGGSGSRLFPVTQAVSKHLLPVYDKPMIYYSLSMLMLAGLKDVLVISTAQALADYRVLLGDGTWLGMRISYAEQAHPGGIPEAFLIGEDFLAGGSASLVLGDNMLYGDRLADHFRNSASHVQGAKIFTYHVPHPERFGVATFDAAGTVIDIQEKPRRPLSNWAVTGMYFYDRTVTAKTRTLTKSARGELEITDLNRVYLAEGHLQAACLGRGMAWLDMGTPDSLLEAAQFVHTVEKRQGLKIACLEEIALNMGFIAAGQFSDLAARAPAGDYGDYLRKLSEQLANGGHIHLNISDRIEKDSR